VKSLEIAASTLGEPITVGTVARREL